MSVLKTEGELLQREVQPRLLVLDADPQVREIASTSLKDSGCQILFGGHRTDLKRSSSRPMRSSRSSGSLRRGATSPTW
jgi:hypothetical protein